MFPGSPLMTAAQMKVSGTNPFSKEGMTSAINGMGGSSFGGFTKPKPRPASETFMGGDQTSSGVWGQDGSR